MKCLAMGASAKTSNQQTSNFCEKCERLIFGNIEISPDFFSPEPMSSFHHDTLLALSIKL